MTKEVTMAGTDIATIRDALEDVLSIINTTNAMLVHDKETEAEAYANGFGVLLEASTESIGFTRINEKAKALNTAFKIAKRVCDEFYPVTPDIPF